MNSLEFELPLVSLLFILILNVVYFSKKKVNLVENKAYAAILVISLIILKHHHHCIIRKNLSLVSKDLRV